MKPFAFLLAAGLATLALAPVGSASPKTTSPGGYLTVRATVTDQGVKMSSTRAPRGATAIFLLTNTSGKDRVFALGDASLKHIRGTGFAVKLAKNERKRVLLYLTYRGPLPLSVGDASSQKVLGIFYVT